MVNLKEKLKNDFLTIDERTNNLNNLSDINHKHNDNQGQPLYLSIATYDNKYRSMSKIRNKINYPDTDKIKGE